MGSRRWAAWLILGRAAAFSRQEAGRSWGLSRQTRGLTFLKSSTTPEASDPRALKIRKLKKAIKRIGQLRLQDYLTLTTAQRVKIHGEDKVLAELATLIDGDVEALRRELQGPKLPKFQTIRPAAPERVHRFFF